MSNAKRIRRNEIWMCDLGTGVGSEQCGIRPVLIVQNDDGNKYSPTIIVAAVTSQKKAKLPTHVEISAKDYGIVKDSVILLEQIKTIDKQRLKEYVCRADQKLMNRVDEALHISLMLHT